MAKGLFESENKSSPKIEPTEIPSGVTYVARFIMAGPVGYQDGVYFLSQCALDDFAWTMKGKPVLMGHQDVLDEKDMKKKAVGYVGDVRRDEDGSFFAEFVVFDSEAIEAINNGDVPYVSCGYRADLSEEDLTINNVKYKKRIVGGEMLHLALVKNPRYNGTEIWRNSSDDYLVSEGVLYNQKDRTMNFFKKVKQEIDKDLLINTSDGEKTIEQLINDLEASKETIAAKDAEIAALKAKLEQPAVEEKPADQPAAPANEVQPETVEEKPADAVETQKVDNDTDADFKRDLNNSLAQEVKKVVVDVPDVSIK